MHPSQSNIGALISPQFALAPAARVAGAATSAAIDRLGKYSCTLVAITGVDGGTPTSFSVPCKLTHCDTSGGSYTDVTSGAITAITAEGTLAQVDINLAGVKRYLKVVMTPAFVGGSTPTIESAAIVILGGPAEPPIT